MILCSMSFSLQICDEGTFPGLSVREQSKVPVHMSSTKGEMSVNINRQERTNSSSMGIRGLYTLLHER